MTDQFTAAGWSARSAWCAAAGERPSGRVFTVSSEIGADSYRLAHAKVQQEGG
ncbi:hypothetical protein [Streptomyces sp. NPDC002573]|uniref:hypothetical protein n=1 Tax=Streptomyces sp. NPDC002573 TaxID=3364651 RepID=UPI0036ADB17B